MSKVFKEIFDTLTDMEKLIARLLFVPLTGIFVFLLFTQFGNSLNDVIYNLTEDYYSIFLKFDTREKVFFWVSVSWITTHIIFEITTHFSKNFRYKRLLTNLRYAPIAILVFSGIVVSIYEAGMLARSKQQIRSYIFDDTQFIVKPDFRLYNNYRGWCGNGASAYENYLYFDAASEGVNNVNPNIRARSLLMTEEVRDSINGGDKRFDNFLANACRDSDAIVQNVAEDVLSKSESSCQKFLIPR